MNEKIKEVKKRVRFLSGLKQKRHARQFQSSDTYWESRYAKGGDSGSGSYGRLAEFKAEVLNDFVKSNGVASVIEFGCGDGNQLSLAEYPSFIGLDVSRTILQTCIKRFSNDSTKSFYVYDTHAFVDNAGVFSSDLSLSLDVIYHLVEDEVFEGYMKHLFGASTRYVIVYTSNEDRTPEVHVRHRKFTKWVAANLPDWELKQTIPNRYPFDPSAPDETSHADFFVFEKRR